MGVPSGMELFIIVAAIVLLFGGKKIPELAKGLGQGIKNFKTAVKDDEPAEVVSTQNEQLKVNQTESTSVKEETTQTTSA